MIKIIFFFVYKFINSINAGYSFNLSLQARYRILINENNSLAQENDESMAEVNNYRIITQHFNHICNYILESEQIYTFFMFTFFG